MNLNTKHTSRENKNNVFAMYVIGGAEEKVSQSIGNNVVYMSDIGVCNFSDGEVTLVHQVTGDNGEVLLENVLIHFLLHDGQLLGFVCERSEIINYSNNIATYKLKEFKCFGREYEVWGNKYIPSEITIYNKSKDLYCECVQEFGSIKEFRDMDSGCYFKIDCSTLTIAAAHFTKVN